MLYFEAVIMLLCIVIMISDIVAINKCNELDKKLIVSKGIDIVIELTIFIFVLLAFIYDI